MSLTASMWTSVSGLLAHGEKMNVIGNNISNVNTVGYKNQRMDFQDFVYQYVGTAAGMGQVGRGTNVGIIMNDFSQGAHETTTSDTDIAIAGNGFFSVRPKTNNVNYYTRAGNFTFDREGYLVDPHGYVLQGWAIDRSAASQVSTDGRNTKGIIGSGSPVDIKLDTFTCPPRHTTSLSMPVNLDNKKIKGQDDKSADPTDPFFALLKQWDASQEVPLGTSKRAHQSTIEVYDEAGKMHKLTIYFDRVVDGTGKQSINGNSIGEDYWEFIVTMDPSEDVRDFSSQWDPSGTAPTTPNVPEKLKGLLGAGTLTFDSTGTMKDMSFFVPQTNPGASNGAWWDANNNVDLSKFVAAPISSNGFPMISPNFSGTGGLQNAYGYNPDGTLNASQPNINGDGRMIAIDLGLRNKTNSWSFVTGPALPADTSLALNTAGTINGKPVDLGGTSAINLNGSQHLIETASFNPADPNWTRRLDENGSPMTLYLLTDNRPGYPSQYYTMDASALPTGVSVANSWAVVDPNPAKFADGSGIAGAAAKPLDEHGQPLYDTLYTESIPGSGVDQVTLYLYDDGTGAHFYSESATHPTATLVRTETYYKSIKETALSDGTVTSAGAPLAANAPKEVNTGGELYDENKLPNPPYTVVARKDAYGNVMKLTEYTLDGKTYYSTDSETDIIARHGAGVSIVSSKTLFEPDPKIIYTGRDGLVTAADIGTSKYHINGMGALAELQPTTITSYEGGFYEHNGFKQDGYTYGDLRYVNVATDGVLSAAYSNGVTLQLFQITLHDFPSNQNLRREGGNLFTETRESGVPSSGAAGTGTFGTTQGRSLEQSNVDLSREFVNMITTQRGFQANSKSITTVDTMLETIISMKR